MMQIRAVAITIVCGLLFVLMQDRASAEPEQPASIASVAAYHRSLPRLTEMLEKKGLELGAPLFIRIFKQPSELEIWLQEKGGRFVHFKTYIICSYSGSLGPKIAAGDKQSPEGFYQVSAEQMNPWSKFHLSFNLGYPNAYDQSLNRTGSALMIHGRCSSVGCYAMTDYYMDEIYTIADAALAKGQTSFQVHIFPFKMTRMNMDLHRHSRWQPFWTNLKQGYDLFEKYRLVPQVEVQNNRYTFTHQYDRSVARIDS